MKNHFAPLITTIDNSHRDNFSSNHPWTHPKPMCPFVNPTNERTGLRCLYN